jgi:hypothetical protein
MLPNGQTVQEDDVLQGAGANYHHGSLDGAPGVFVDDPSDPAHPQTVFTPIPPDGSPETHGFIPSPVLGPNGEPYYDRVVWSDRNHQAILRVDARGQPVGTFVKDAGRVDDAPSPLDVLGPPGVKLGVGLTAEALERFGLPALRTAESFLGRTAGSFLERIAPAASAAETETAEQAARDVESSFIQRGGAHRDVKGLPGYQSHHMPADSISPIPRESGPAIAMKSDHHLRTASWGRDAASIAYRQRQADLISQGDFRGAQQMDIDDVRSKFGSIYDDAIAQLLKYTADMGW